MVPSYGMCIGVTPNGVAGRNRPSMRSATACAITLAASVSVPVGRCGPCCSTLPQGRITNGFFLSCAAISGCVRSAKQRLGNMAASLGETFVGLGDDVGKLHRLAIPLDGAQPGIDCRERHIAVPRVQLVGFSGAAAFREHLKLGAEHV